ncbi:MAG TPA: hypothetical protein PKG52_08335 [bacterium]|nr:hypothetical protein [bacterium]
MKKKIKYKCSECDKVIEIYEGDSVPNCCSKKMTKMHPCTKAQTAEMSRGGDDDSPCDDFRGE